MISKAVGGVERETKWGGKGERGDPCMSDVCDVYFRLIDNFDNFCYAIKQRWQRWSLLLLYTKLAYCGFANCSMHFNAFAHIFLCSFP